MGYTTEFKGSFKVNKQLDNDTKKLLNGLANTRRMKRSIDKLAIMLNITKEEALQKYGEEGELYFDENNFDDSGQSNDDSIIDYNEPATNQPGLWLHWNYNEEKQCIEWNGSEKFYHYIDWLEYIIDRILKPKNYSLTGIVRWKGSRNKDEKYQFIVFISYNPSDFGSIAIVNNKIELIAKYSIEEHREQAIKYKKWCKEFLEKHKLYCAM